MKDTKRRIELFSLYDHTNIEKHLEKMAAKGWLIEEIGKTFWRYKRIEQQKLKFSVVYYPKKVNEGILVSEDRQNFIDMCSAGGWDFVISSDKMHVFCSENENTPPIETDALIQIECIHKFAKHEIIGNYLSLALACILIIASFGYAVWNEPINAITNYLYRAWFSPFFIIFSLYNIISYLVWHKKAMIAAKQGEFSKTKRLIKIEVLFWVPIYACSALLESFTLLRARYVLFAIGLIATAVMMLYLFRFIKKAFANAKMNEETKRIIKDFTALFLFIVYVAVGISAFQIMPKPYEKIEVEKSYGTDVSYVYHDEGAPLNIEEFIQTDKRISKEKFCDNAILVEREKWTQFTVEEKDIYLRYEITDIHYTPLYERCKNELITENKIYDFTETQIKGLAGYEAYQSSRLDSFAFCRDGRIVQIDFDWEPTDEQIAIAAEKLMNADI